MFVHKSHRMIYVMPSIHRQKRREFLCADTLRNGASDGLMCDTCHLRIGKGDLNISNPPKITDNRQWSWQL